MILVNEQRCPADHACPLTTQCPVGAISQEGYEVPAIDHKKCIECGLCTENCPKNAVAELELATRR